MVDFSSPYNYPRPVLRNELSELWPINSWKDAGVTIEMIDHGNMLVVFSNGIFLPIIAMFDKDGGRVEDWEDASSYDFGHPCFGYGTARCDGDPIYVH